MVADAHPNIVVDEGGRALGDVHICASRDVDSKPTSFCEYPDTVRREVEPSFEDEPEDDDTTIEQDPTLAIDKSRLYCWYLFVSVLCVLGTTTIVTSIMASQRDGHENEGSSHQSIDDPSTGAYTLLTAVPSTTTQPHTETPTTSPTGILAPSWLPAFTLETIKANPDSPQAQAFHWVEQRPTDTPLWRKKQLLALGTLYLSADSEDQRRLPHHSEHECTWLVEWKPKCTNSGRYHNLNFHFNVLPGPIPPEISLLRALTSLRLNRNGWTGPLPTELGLLLSLRDLDISHNKDLSGSLPSELGQLSFLKSLKLGGNQLSGQLPPEIGLLTTLKHLDLFQNDLEGSLPKSFESLTALTSLSADYNDFTGPLPTNLVELMELRVYHNRFDGTIPTTLPALKHLNVGANTLIGTIPTNLVSLEELNLSNNDWKRGLLPTHLWQMTNLTSLYLSGSQWEGPLPKNLGNLTALSILSLKNNRLNGTIPSALQGLTDLKELYLHGNSLHGSIPSAVCGFSSLEYIWVDCESVTCNCRPHCVCA